MEVSEMLTNENREREREMKRSFRRRSMDRDGRFEICVCRLSRADGGEMEMRVVPDGIGAPHPDIKIGGGYVDNTDMPCLRRIFHCQGDRRQIGKGLRERYRRFGLPLTSDKIVYRVACSFVQARAGVASDSPRTTCRFSAAEGAKCCAEGPSLMSP
jgi:hypothetical protein